MHALRQDACTGCAGPARQKCKDRPGIQPLSSTSPTAAAQASTLLGDQRRFEINRRFGSESATPERPRWIARLKAGFASFRAGAAERRRNRQIDLELPRLDDRTLRDIGISRPEIEAAMASVRSGRR